MGHVIVVVVTLFPTKIHENTHMYNTFTVVSTKNVCMYFVSGCQKKLRLIELAAAQMLLTKNSSQYQFDRLDGLVQDGRNSNAIYLFHMKCYWATDVGLHPNHRFYVSHVMTKYWTTTSVALWEYLVTTSCTCQVSGNRCIYFQQSMCSRTCSAHVKSGMCILSSIFWCFKLYRLSKLWHMQV